MFIYKDGKLYYNEEAYDLGEISIVEEFSENEYQRVKEEITKGVRSCLENGGSPREILARQIFLARELVLVPTHQTLPFSTIKEEIVACYNIFGGPSTVFEFSVGVSNGRVVVFIGTGIAPEWYKPVGYLYER